MSGRSADSAGNRAVVLAALVLILATTVIWWALALWPLSTSAPVWLVRTRAVCFGAAPRGLPDASGWVALLLQPALMVGTLFAVWGREVRDGTRALARGWPGRTALGLLALMLAIGIGGAVIRIASAEGPREAASAADRGALAFERLNREAPSFDLVDQHGQRVSLDRFQGRPVLVTFAFAHCETVCPLVVTETVGAQRRFIRERGQASRPAVIVITLDPWRDTPARLPYIAGAWDLGPDAHVLSGTRTEVNRALDAWQVSRERDPSTGDIVHPARVYVVDGAGRLAYAAPGNAELLVELLTAAVSS